GQLIEHVQRQPPLGPVSLLIRNGRAGPPGPDRRRVLRGGRLPVIPAGRQEQPPVQGQEAVSVTAQIDTPIWQLPTLPSVPEYCRATPGEAVPSLTKPVSSTTHACGAITSIARRASRCRTGSTAQVEEERNCCSPCSSTPSRAAIGC